jgi:tetratricopeptide (TPR) repeat protein
VKKETIITAAVFLSVGFLAGYAYRAHESAAAAPIDSASSVQSPGEQSGTADNQGDAARGNAASAAPGGTEAAIRGTGPASSPGLPPGHPAIDAETRIKFLEEEAAKQPADPGPRLRLANFFYDQKQFERAIEWYQKTLQLDPSNINARTDMGTSYLSLGRAQEAIREYHKSLQLDPKHQPTLFNLIVANLDGTHNLDAAQVAWNELHKLNPNYPGLEPLKQGLAAARK